MPIFLHSNVSCPKSHALADAARAKGWRAASCEDHPRMGPRDEVAYWGGLDVTVPIAARLGLGLIEPPLDLLARLPDNLLRRAVSFATVASLGELSEPTFVKPADPVDKPFDAGVYSDASEIAMPLDLDLASPVLLSEPVEWTCEYRCFVSEGRVRAWSPYLSFGTTVWKPFLAGRTITEVPHYLWTFCNELHGSADVPPAFVVDVGLIPDRGWAVVEFNPVWGSNPLGADPAGVLDVLARACRPLSRISEEDRRWVILRQIDPAKPKRISYNPHTTSSFRFTDEPATTTKPHYA